MSSLFLNTILEKGPLSDVLHRPRESIVLSEGEPPSLGTKREFAMVPLNKLGTKGTVQTLLTFGSS
jgi:hypothetical protein